MLEHVFQTAGVMNAPPPGIGLSQTNFLICTNFTWHIPDNELYLPNQTPDPNKGKILANRNLLKVWHQQNEKFLIKRRIFRMQQGISVFSLCIFLRLNTMDTISKIDCSSTFYWLCRNQALSPTLNISVNSSSNSKIRVSLTWGFQNWPWSLNFMQH